MEKARFFGKHDRHDYGFAADLEKAGKMDAAFVAFLSAAMAFLAAAEIAIILVFRGSDVFALAAAAPPAAAAILAFFSCKLGLHKH